MTPIVINGVDLSELKAKQEAYNKEVAEVRSTIRQGAAQFIAERVAEVKATVAKLKEAMEQEDPVHADIIALANEATDKLAQVEFVADVSGVSFELPFPDNSYSYGGYSSDDIITSIIEESEVNGTYYWRLRDNPETVAVYEALAALYDQAETLESQVQEWNSSYC